MDFSSFMGGGSAGGDYASAYFDMDSMGSFMPGGDDAAADETADSEEAPAEDVSVSI